MTAISCDYTSSTNTPASLVAKQGRRTIGQLVASLVLIYEVLEAGEMAGRLEFL